MRGHPDTAEQRPRHRRSDTLKRDPVTYLLAAVLFLSGGATGQAVDLVRPQESAGVEVTGDRYFADRRDVLTRLERLEDKIDRMLERGPR